MQSLKWEDMPLSPFIKDFLWKAQAYFHLPFDAIISTFLGVMASVCQQKFVVKVSMLNESLAQHRLNLFIINFNRGEPQYASLYKSFLHPLNKEEQVEKSSPQFYFSDIDYESLLFLYTNCQISSMALIDYLPNIIYKINKDKRLHNFLLKGFDNFETRLFNKENRKYVFAKILTSITICLPFINADLRNFFTDLD